MPDGQLNTSSRQSAASIKPSQYTVLVPLKGARHLAYNTVAQSFSIWDAKDIALWRDLESNGALRYDARYRGFVQGGYVVNADADEREALRASYDKVRNNDGHMMLTIAPTLSCNFGCHYCFQGLDKPLTKMTPKVREATKSFLIDSLKGKECLNYRLDFANFRAGVVWVRRRGRLRGPFRYIARPERPTSASDGRLHLMRAAFVGRGTGCRGRTA
jgi:hypothetical protein